MSVESRFEEGARELPRHADLITSHPGLRPVPDGLIIDLDEGFAATLSDTVWQEEYGKELWRPLQLNPKFNGERCGSLYARFIVKKDLANGITIIDRYVHLGNVLVNNTRRQGTLRTKGIGSALLTMMENYATRFDASRIEGIISPVDLPTTPTLPSFL